MEINSSGEELVVKIRKPYTMTKQRERWTEEEHNRFLEALKLYGRAWQRIEDHIGSKTAVQIRSHAQKFFTKLEKESVAKGTPMGKARDIHIPPPRPKRKPSSPYPRKSGAKSVYSQKTTKEDLILQKTLSTTKSVQGVDVCSDRGDRSVLNLFQETSSASAPFTSKGSTNTISFNEFVPIVNDPKEGSSVGGSSLSFEVNVESSMNERVGNSKDLYAFQKRSIPGEFLAVQEQSVIPCEIGNQKDAQSHKDQAANDVLSICTDTSNSKVTDDIIEFPPSACPFMKNTIPEASELQTHLLAMSSIPPPFVTFPQFAPFHSTHDFYRSFLDISSTFSSCFTSTLLQNSAAHLAVHMPASFRPSGELDSLTDSSIASIGAATASWWASHGLFPFFPHVHSAGFSIPHQTNAIPIANTGQFRHNKMEEGFGAHQNSSRNQDSSSKGSGHLNTQPPSSKSGLTSSSDSDEIENYTSNINNLKHLSGTAAYYNVGNAKINGKPERSSCGSNTPSSSEVETDAAAFKTNGETNNEAQQVHCQNLPQADLNFRRARSSGGSMNDSWKEVSQEGRVAFQALFARDILPQTFLHQHVQVETGFPKNMLMEKEKKINQNCLLPNEIGHGSLKVRRTGFKPYKRCSAEVEFKTGLANDETSNKRIHLEGETSP